MPGPSSDTVITAPSPSGSTDTRAVVPAGVWARTLPSRLSMTWRRLVASPSTSMGWEAWKVTGQSGPTVEAVCTASAQRATRSTDRRSMGRPSSSRASSSRSATSCSMRVVSVRIPPISRSRSAFCSEAPRPNSSA